MSETTSVGVVGPSYWTYAAFLVADSLENIIARRSVERDLISTGAYDDVRSFFDLALQVTGDNLPENPPASINAYVIAAAVLRNAEEKKDWTTHEIGDRLREYNEFLNLLNSSRQLSPVELEIAAELRLFLLDLAQDGECESYEHSITFNPLQIGHMFR